MTQREVDRVMKSVCHLSVSGRCKEASETVEKLLERLKRENWKKIKIWGELSSGDEKSHPRIK